MEVVPGRSVGQRAFVLLSEEAALWLMRWFVTLVVEAQTLEC